ncbi:MAG: hypothetical protein RLZZ368_1377 [Actinomycetota bacterium]
MTTYVDTSALAKLYVAEADSADARRHMQADPVLATSWLTVVELRRVLSKALDGADLRQAIRVSEEDLDRIALINPDERVWRAAADIAAELGVRSLDAVHLACARILDIDNLTVCTFDLRMAQAARHLGFRVVGA